MEYFILVEEIGLVGQADGYHSVEFNTNVFHDHRSLGSHGELKAAEHAVFEVRG